MVIKGNTPVFVRGHQTRVNGWRFNEELRKGRVEHLISNAEGQKIVPSAGRTWEQVAEMIRAGKSVQAKVEG